MNLCNWRFEERAQNIYMMISLDENIELLVLKRQGNEIFYSYFVLKTLNLGPLWTGKMFVFIRKYFIKKFDICITVYAVTEFFW